MSDEQQRKRRVLIAIVAAVALIGAAGVTISLLVGDDDGAATPEGLTTPGATVEPLTIEGQCRAAGVAKYRVATDSAATELTATGAAERWVHDGESSRTSSTGDAEKLVSIGRPGQLPRVVLVIAKKPSGWAIVETGGCLDPTTTGGRACTEETFTLGRTVYTRAANGTEEPQPGSYVGTGWLRLCPETVEGQQLAPRGAIGPVSAYAAPQKTGVVVSDAQRSTLFTR